MTTKQASSDLKLTALKSLNQPALIQAWINDVKNAARTCLVTYIDEDGNKASYGNLGLLYSAGVTQWKPPLATETERRELVVRTVGGKRWPKELVDEMDTELYSRLYAAMGDDLRTRVSDKFDKEDVTGELPKATELLRYIVSKIKMVDPRAQERKANADLESHLNTSMPPGVTAEQMFEWCDKTETLNAKCNPGKQEHELIERTIMAMPDDIVEKIEIKTEHAGAHSDYHAAQAEWAGVIERHTERETRRASERAMNARAMNATGTAPGTDQQTDNPDIIEMQKKIAELKAQLNAIVEGMGVTAGLEAAHATGMVRSQHPYHEPCGSNHADGDDGCWMMHPDQVPKSMGFMLAGLHRKRAAKNLPDLTEQYPPHN